MDYTSKLPWEDSDTEENPKLQEVSEATRKTLEKACQMRMANPTRLQTRAPYPLPKVPATRTMTLDSYLKPEVSSSIKSDDKELGKIQAFVLDALAPLSAILEAADGDQSMTVGEVKEAAVAGVQLIGNASSKIAHLRRRKVVTHLNQALVPLVEDDSHFKDAAPSLFGMGVCQKSKGACGAGSASLKGTRDSTTKIPPLPFFGVAPPPAGGVGGATTRGTPGAEHPTGSTGDTKGETRPEARDSGTPRTNNNPYSINNYTVQKCLQRYSCETIRGYGDNPNSIPKLASRKASLPFRELEYSNKGSSGAKHSSGLSIRAPNRAIPEGVTTPTSLLCGAEQANTGGSRGPCPERGNYTGKSTTRGLLLQSLPCAKERWWAEAGGKPQSPESVRTTTALQNGGNPYSPGHNKARRLASKGRSEGCLPHSPDTSAPQEVPKVQLPGQNIPVQLSPIWPVIGTLGLYQDPQASDSPPSGVGGQVDCVYRRHPPLGGDQGGSKRTLRSADLSATGSRLYNQSEEIHYGSVTLNRVSGVTDQHPNNDFESTARQNEKDSCGGTKASGSGNCTSQRSGPPTGEDECNIVRDPSCSTLLSPLTNVPVRSSKQECSVLRSASPPLSREQRGTSVVGHTHEELEWENPSKKGDRPDNRLRCISNGLGSSLSGPKDRRSMVETRETDAHQLPGADGSNTGSTDIYKESDRSLGAAEDRQHYSSSLHQQPWGHSLQGATGSVKESVDVVPGTEYPYHCTAPTGHTECHSRYGVSGDDRSVRLVTRPKHIQEDQPDTRSPGDRPVCDKADNTVQSLLQLAARSLCRSNRCFPTGLVPGEGLCQPTMVSGGEGSSSSTVTTSSHCTSGPGLEDTALVPHVTVNASTIPISSEPDSRGHGRSTPANTRHTASRMEHLRQRYREQELSEKATSLMLKSWRTKTNKSYDTLFTKWHGWCSGRDKDSFSGPVNNVVNFLASLHEEGYQYNSINSYRSAISSVHEEVDGYSIGQHPLVTKLMKGIFHDRPPLPRYTSTWKVDMVLSYLKALGPNKDLSLKHLSWKTTMLLALTRPSRSADLANLDITGRQYKPEGVAFTPCALAKQSRQGKPITEFFFPSFADDLHLCPVEALKEYEGRTRELRSEETRLLVSYIKPHNKITSSSIARWIKSLLEAAGVDTSIFSAHSVRGASSSTAANMGITTNDILKAGSESVFHKFYYKSSENPSFGRAVLSSGSKGKN